MLSLSMICKPEEYEILDRALGSAYYRDDNENVVTPFDEIIVVVNTGSDKYQKVLDVCNKHDAHCYERKWDKSFCNQRNFSLEKCSEPVVMWLDADDVIVKPELIRPAAQTIADNNLLGIVQIPYDYAHDEDDNVILVNARERIFRRDSYKWIKHVHENLASIDVTAARPEVLADDGLVIKHRPIEGSEASKMHRNLEIAEKVYNDNVDKPVGSRDIANIWDYARALHAAGRVQESFVKFIEFSKVSPVMGFAYHALNRAAKICIDDNKAKQGITVAHEMIKMDPMASGAYLTLGRAYHMLEQYDECIMFSRFGMKIGTPDVSTGIPVNPQEYTTMPLSFIYDSYLAQQDAERASKVCDEALAIVPKSKEWLDRKSKMEEIKGALHRYDITVELMNFYAKNDKDKYHKLLTTFPSVTKSDPKACADLMAIQGVSKDKRLVIYCGRGYESWGPDSIGKGIGGSEEMVIYLAPALAKLGWNVEVYCERTQVEEIDGVKWFPNNFFVPTVEAEVFVSWRLPGIIDQFPQIKADKKYLWLHDVPIAWEYKKEVVDSYDKIMVLSDYHKGLLPDTVPEDKIIITSNAIIPEQFETCGSARNNKSVIYASLPDRGLEGLLSVWDDVVKEVPDANLHIFYGFNPTYLKLMETNPVLQLIKDRIEDSVASLPNITWHGMVGHQELANWYQTCGVWAYPTHFPEVFCITAVKAQAGGAVPVTTDCAALDQMVQYGVKVHAEGTGTSVTIDLEAYKKELIDMLKDDRKQGSIRKDMCAWAKHEYSMDTLAKRWSEEFEL